MGRVGGARDGHATATAPAHAVTATIRPSHPNSFPPNHPLVSRTQVLRPFVLRRTKAEVEGELPGKRAATLRTGLSAWQAAWYRQLAERGSLALGSGARRGGLRNMAMQLRKVCLHPYLFLDHVDPAVLDAAGVGGPGTAPGEELVRASGKLSLLDDVLPKLKATGHRVLLFSQMTRALDVLGDYLTMRGHAHLRLDGTTKTEDRARLLSEFNAPGSPHFVFLLSTRAGGLGLNLQSADTVIMFDSDWNPQVSGLKGLCGGAEW